MPLIVPGQAGKDIIHNEALERLAILVQPTVESVGDTTPPAEPVVGRAWILGDAPTGAWAGYPHAIAAWTGGGWRFVMADEGMTAWVAPSRLAAQFLDGAWEVGEVRAHRLSIDGAASVGLPQPAPAEPVEGENIDAESRSSIVAILDVLRYHGLILP